MPKQQKELTQKQYCALLEMCVDGCKKDYCFLKWVIGEMRSSPRLLLQLKLIEIMKWELSEAADHDIGGNEAAEKWVTEGYAEVFADLFDEEATPRKLYKEVVDKVKSRKLK